MHIVELTFGHCSYNGELLPPDVVSQAETRALRVLSNAFRGAQLQRQMGSYVTTSGRFMIEPCTVIWTYAPDVSNHTTQLRHLAGEIAGLLRQETVLLAITDIDCTLDWVEALDYRSFSRAWPVTIHGPNGTSLIRASDDLEVERDESANGVLTVE